MFIALRALFLVFSGLFGLFSGSPTWADSAPQTVTLASRDGTPIQALVFQPTEAGAAPAPPRVTVVALHGCGGLHVNRGPRRGELNARHRAMADMLLASGHAVVFPDSLGPRGETELCTQKIGSRTIDQRHRRADALATIAWVAAQPWADARRVVLLGWSHGGSAVLSATDASRADVQQSVVQPALAVAFYPGCSAPLKSGYRMSAPLVLMLGEKDDWTPPEPCIELGRNIGAEVNLYADSYHDFDNPVGEVTLRRDVPNGARPGEGVHAGRNPAAREAAYARLAALLDALPTSASK
jgi:dienelactone hydrolase